MAYTLSPSTVGVDRGPGYPPPPPDLPTFASHNLDPSLRLTATTLHAPRASSPRVRTLSPTTATLENPVPTPSAFQATGGPSGGQDLSRPLSVETPSRLGPRNCGQSGSAAATGKAEMASATSKRRFMERSSETGGRRNGR